MITRYEVQIQALSTDEDKTDHLNSPTRVSVERSLNGLSYAQLVYPSRMEELLFSDGEDFLYPSAMRLMVRMKAKDREETEDKVFYQGVLSSYDVTPAGELKLTYVDPLVVATEVDRSENWQSSTLGEILSQSLKNASSERGGKSLQMKFEEGGQLPIASATNMGQTDLSFIQTLSRRYGFRFFFNHESTSAEEVIFFTPKLSKLPDVEIPYEEIQATASLRVSMLAVPSSVVVQKGDGQESLKMGSFKSSFSTSFEKKVEMRERLGIDLNTHLFCPGISTREAKAICEAEFHARAMQGDYLEFFSEEFYPLGALVKVCANNSSYSRGKRFEGVYMIEKVQSVQQGLGWIHQYRGVRP